MKSTRLAAITQTIALTVGTALHVAAARTVVVLIYLAQIEGDGCASHQGVENCPYEVSTITIITTKTAAIASIAVCILVGVIRIVRGRSAWWVPFASMAVMTAVTVACVAAVHLAYD